jgi:hypothetical protein
LVGSTVGDNLLFGDFGVSCDTTTTVAMVILSREAYYIQCVPKVALPRRKE